MAKFVGEWVYIWIGVGKLEQLLGNPGKAKRQLGWTPEVTFEKLVKIMTDGDLRLLDKKGYEIGF